jgi:hypothetical protein
MVEAGMTHAEIAAECERITGHKVARSTVSAALSRAALVKKEGHRYYETVPWRVQPEHASEYAVRMLRLLGRRRAGIPLDIDSEQRLDSFLAMLERERVVVAYCPEHEDGFLYVDEALRAGPNPDIPIRVQVLRLSEVVA